MTVDVLLVSAVFVAILEFSKFPMVPDAPLVPEKPLYVPLKPLVPEAPLPPDQPL